MALHAGLVAVTQDSDGALRPLPDWYLSPATVQIGDELAYVLAVIDTTDGRSIGAVTDDETLTTPGMTRDVVRRRIKTGFVPLGTCETLYARPPSERAGVAGQVIRGQGSGFCARLWHTSTSGTPARSAARRM